MGSQLRNTDKDLEELEVSHLGRRCSTNLSTSLLTILTWLILKFIEDVARCQ